MTLDQPATEDNTQPAKDLLEEWDEGRGTSKSAIERRVWNDGGAHGRKFDRFIQQTLGIGTTKPSKQTERIESLEAQLRQHGLTPAGLESEEWESQLHHARNAALSALRVWNDPTATFRTETFALLFVTAWNSIALAVLQRAGEEWRDLTADGDPKMIDGRERALPTDLLMKSAFGSQRHVGLLRNTEFWIGLRNKVAHRSLPTLDTLVIPYAQAGLLNFEEILDEKFGSEYCLAERLSIALQLSGFRDPDILMSVKQLQTSLPLDVQAYLATRSEQDEEFMDDPSYRLRVTLIPVVPSSGRRPDAVINFVRPDEVTEELRRALEEYHVLPKVILSEHPQLIPKQVVKAVADKIPYRFTIYLHTQASQNLGLRPRTKDYPTQTDLRYCKYIPSIGRHLYNEAWIKRLVEELSTPEGFRAATGREPQPRD